MKSCLHFAAYNNSCKTLAKFLIDRGLDVNSVDEVHILFQILKSIKIYIIISNVIGRLDSNSCVR